MSEEIPKTKCDELEFEHAWVEYEDMFQSTDWKRVYSQYCPNCGLVRTLKKKEWYEYKVVSAGMKKKPKPV